MADNTHLNPGAGGDLIASDDIGGVKFQRVKLVFGADGVNAGDVAASNPFPITVSDLELGTTGGMTGLRDLLMAQRYTVLADSLADGLAAFWTSTTASGGTVTSTGGEGLFQTSANATGAAQLTGTPVVYLPGQVAWFNSAIRVGDTGSVGNTRRWGAFTVAGTTPQDGFYYELNDTTLNAVVVKAGVATAVASTAWTRVVEAPFTLDTNFHFFEIRFTGNTVWFYVDNVLRHRVSGTNTPITTTLNFPKTIQTVNTSGATNRIIAARNVGLGRFGTPDSAESTSGYQPRSLSLSNTPTAVKTSSGQVGGWQIYNPNATAAYVQFFNAQTGAVTLGTTAPFYTIGLAGTSGVSVAHTAGIAHPTAITIAATTTRAGAAAPGTALDVNVFFR